jgi:hypothetical protein
MQGDGIITKRLLRAVASVTEDRKATVTELNPDLMMPSRLKRDLNQTDTSHRV